MTPPLVYLIAGEPSGDLIGARLIDALRELTGGRVAFAGIGGEAMRAEGMDSLFPQKDLAVMGLVEVLPRIPKVLRRLKETLAHIEALQPAVIVTIDSWGFTGRVAQRLKAAGSKIPRVHYVAPMVWAWKEKRVHQVAERVDRLLCLLPIEPPYFEKAGLTALHVGHPVIEGYAGDGTAFRARHRIPEDAPLLAVLPGSRLSEISRLLPIFADTVRQLAATRPQLQVVVPTVETVAEAVERETENWPVNAIVVRGKTERMDAFAASRAALAASGTVALELGRAGTPMAVAYRASPITAMIVRRLLKVPYACLLNLLLDAPVVPEFLQERCQAKLLAPTVARLLDDETVRLAQIASIRQAMDRLGLAGEVPSRRAARAVLELI